MNKETIFQIMFYCVLGFKVMFLFYIIEYTLFHHNNMYPDL